jgi:hypothetical protein
MHRGGQAEVSGVTSVRYVRDYEVQGARRCQAFQAFSAIGTKISGKLSVNSLQLSTTLSNSLQLFPLQFPVLVTTENELPGDGLKPPPPP